MPGEQSVEVYRQHRTAQDKYTYFLLAAAGAAIALAVNQTQTATLSWSQWPLGSAVLLWGLSFVFGCRRLQWVDSTLYNNAEMLRVESGRHQLTGSDPYAIAALSPTIREALERGARKASTLGKLQFYVLICGAVFYLGWHIHGMWLRT